MRVDTVPELNEFLAFTVAGLKARRSILADQLDALDRLIAVNETASLAEALPGEKDLPSKPTEKVFTQWKKDIASGRPQAQRAADPAQPSAPIGENGLPQIFDPGANGGAGAWADDLVGGVLAEKQRASA